MTSTRNNPPVEQNGYLAFIVQTSPDNLKLALLPPMTLVRTRAISSMSHLMQKHRHFEFSRCGTSEVMVKFPHMYGGL